MEGALSRECELTGREGEWLWRLFGFIPKDWRRPGFAAALTDLVAIDLPPVVVGPAAPLRSAAGPTTT